MHEIPGYSQLEPIGSGGTATVYRATQESIGREVAIKVLAAPALDARTEKRFTRESQALGALGWHPNIGVLFDAGQTPRGVPYIAMEYLGGGALGGDSPMTAAETASVGIRIAGALHCAHEAGVLHRDVKPANILRSVFGEVKLADFGISGLVDATHTTGGGMTLAHVSPEVVEGGTATVASDVYSLASTLFELLAGHAPFVEGDAAEQPIAMLLRIIDAPAPDLRTRGVPDQLVRVIEQGLAKDPAARPTAESFGRMLVDVEQALGWSTTTLPIATPRTGPPPPTHERRMIDTTLESGPPPLPPT